MKKTWQWLSRGGLKVGTEALLCAPWEQAIRTSYMKYHIDETSESPLCRLPGNVDTTMLQRKFIGIFLKRTG